MAFQGYQNYRDGIRVQTSAAIDKRLVLTKAEMLTAHVDFLLPDTYFCMCLDDGKLYLYNKDNEAISEIGKYRLIEDTLDFSSETFKQHFETALENSQKIIQVNAQIETINAEITDLQTNLDTVADAVVTLEGRVDILEPKVTTLETRVDVLEPKVSDLEPRVAAAEIAIDQAEEDIEAIQTWISKVKLDGGEVKAQYTLTKVLQNVTPSAGNPDTVSYRGNVNLVFTANTGYILPDTVLVNNIIVGSTIIDCGYCNAKWTKTTGILEISTAINDIAYSITGIEEE